MIRVFDLTVYALLEPGVSLSFVTPYVAMNFEIILEKHSKPFSVSTPVGESILEERLYRDCYVSVSHKSAISDLIELDMVDFDLILSTDWLHACFVSIDCRNQIVNYYRRLFEGFSSNSSPLIKMTEKTTKFLWSEACEKSFQELKKRLTIATVLSLPEGIQGFVVYSDTSRVCLGCLTMKNGKVIAYAFKVEGP
ncbi:uncharacterized protein [Solanum lycopersicum]|uniref:uncharacterized protein n=1 Tax=Solanum lycopersicum TaxID=4081 RepID=UPI0037492B6C